MCTARPVTACIDQFGGIGWGFACRELGIDETGIDIEPTVELTRKSLGWGDHSICADILDLDPHDFAGIDGLISSPPCQSWSRAGKGAGLDDPRGQLVWQPLVWAFAIRPRWIVCEQVPEARGAFELIAWRLGEIGYHATTYTVSAETLGVPQTRLRVFLVAHRDRPVDRPTLTHQRYRKGRPRIEPTDMLGHLSWVSMAEALLTRSVNAKWWPAERPATTVCADPRISSPMHHTGSQNAGAVPVDQAGADKPVALTEQQGCTLMSFPPGTHEHLQGNKQDRWRIIGNAVCPPVARAVLETVIA